MQARGSTAGNAQFTNMLKVGRELGCQIRPGANNPSILLGLCPFHEAKTLHISLENARGASLAKPPATPWASWQKCGACRPRRPTTSSNRDVPLGRSAPNGSPNPSGPPQAQNTAILTMATRFYGRQVEHLERSGASPEEMEASPLFQEITGMEYLSGCAVLSDLDWTGATTWMMAILPEGNGNPGLTRRRPRIRGVPGRRNRLLNLRSLGQRNGTVTVTDDPRLYLALEATGHAAALVTHMRRENNVGAIADRSAQGLGRLGLSRVIIAMHDLEMGKRTAEALAKANPKTVSEQRSLNEMMRQIDPRQRDLASFTAASKGPPNQAPDTEEKPPEHSGETESPREEKEEWVNRREETAAGPRQPEGAEIPGT